METGTLLSNDLLFSNEYKIVNFLKLAVNVMKLEDFNVVTVSKRTPGLSFVGKFIKSFLAILITDVQQRIAS